MAGDASRANGRKGGRPKGSLSLGTLDKLEAREYVRKRIAERLEPLLDALFAKASGTKFLVYRNEFGRFIPMTERTIKAVKAKNYERLEVYDRQPDVSAIQELLNRCIDPPKATIAHEAGEGMAEMLARLDRAKEASRKKDE